MYPAGRQNGFSILLANRSKNRLSVLTTSPAPPNRSPTDGQPAGRQTLQIALVGCGALAEMYYSPALRELARAESITVSALVDPVEERLGTLGSCFPEAQKYRDLNAFQPTAVDLAIVASPQRFHAAQTIALLRSGLPVL